jgi:hypothetical protein
MDLFSELRGSSSIFKIFSSPEIHRNQFPSALCEESDHFSGKTKVSQQLEHFGTDGQHFSMIFMNRHDNCMLDNECTHHRECLELQMRYFSENKQTAVPLDIHSQSMSFLQDFQRHTRTSKANSLLPTSIL